MRQTLVLGVLALGLVTGCGARAFPAQLFTIEGAGADYPVMLSRVDGAKAGRPIEAESGTQSSASHSSYTMGNTTVTVSQSSHAQSELSAATKLAAQVRRNDKWLQIDRAVFSATDFATYGASSARRNLSLRGTLQR